MFPLSTAVLVYIAALDHIAMAVIYFKWHRWRSNTFTVWLAILVVSFALILTYVAYNVTAALTGLPVASGTWIANLAYGIVAAVGLLGVYVFVRETRKNREEI